MRVLSGLLQHALVFVWLCMLSALFSNLVKTRFDPRDYRTRDYRTRDYKTRDYRTRDYRTHDNRNLAKLTKLD